MKVKTLFATTLALGISLANVTASAETFRAATWAGANSPNTKFLTDVAEQLKTASNGEIEFEVFSGGSLLNPKGSLSGLGSDIAQLGNITASYIPSDLPVTNVVTDLSFIAEDQMALAFAYTELKFFNQQLLDELKDKNVVFGSGFTIGIYNLICGFEAKSIDDFKGKKIRASSGAQIEYTNLLGGTAVSVPATEIYTGIQRGSLDCAMGTPLFLTDFFKLTEVAKSVYMIPLGSAATDGFYFNKDFWQERSPEERRTILNVMSRASAKLMIDWGANIDKAFDAARQANIALVDPEPAAVEQLQAFNKQFVADLPKESMEKRGIDDPTPLINETIAALDKWQKLLSEIDRNDVDAVTALLNREIFDKIDVETYGTN